MTGWFQRFSLIFPILAIWSQMQPESDEFESALRHKMPRKGDKEEWLSYPLSCQVEMASSGRKQGDRLAGVFCNEQQYRTTGRKY